MRRIDIYKLQVLETIDVVEYIAQDRLHNLDFWAETRDLYAELVRGMTNFEIAETFYNSIFNAVFEHRWIRDDYAFVFSPQGDMPPVDVRRVLNQYRTKGDFKTIVANLLFDYGMSLPYEDYDREVARVTEVMTAAVEDAGYDRRADLELHALEHHFFRNKAAYIVGRISGKGLQIPFVLPCCTRRIKSTPVFTLMPACWALTSCRSSSRSHEPTSWSMPRFHRNTSYFCSSYAT